jgi:SAM-dependent methyltransferase
MAHLQQQEFCQKIKSKYPQFFNKKIVLDMGSLDINGENRNLFIDSDYLGIDLGEGPNVDFICVAHKFEGPDDYYDVIISTEMFEHDMYYEKSIKNAIRMLKPGGLFIFTCASTGREEHGTRRLTPGSAPFLMDKDDWGNYYKNLTEEDIKKIDGFNCNFPDGVFEYNPISCDLYFHGIKNGNDYLKYFIDV